MVDVWRIAQSRRLADLDAIACRAGAANLSGDGHGIFVGPHSFNQAAFGTNKIVLSNLLSLPRGRCCARECYILHE